MNKTIVFLRHAHRDTEDRRVDNGLTEKGQKQAKRIAAFYQSRFPKKDYETSDILLLTSPKLRCLETIQPLEAISGVKVKETPELHEGLGTETYDEFASRVIEFCEWWKAEAPTLTVVCSHGDWLPIAVHHILGSVVYFKKGGWLELDWLEDQAHLRWYIPTFKYF